MNHPLRVFLFCVLFLAASQACSLSGLWQGTSEQLLTGVTITPTTVPTTTTVGSTPPVLLINYQAPETIPRSIVNYVVEFDSPLVGNVSGASVVLQSEFNLSSVQTFAQTFHWNTSSQSRCVVRWWGTFVATQTSSTQGQLSFDASNLHCSFCNDTQPLDTGHGNGDCNLIPNSGSAGSSVNNDYERFFLNGSVCLTVPGVPASLLTFNSACTAFTAEGGLIFTLNSTGVVLVDNGMNGPSDAGLILSYPKANNNNNNNIGGGSGRSDLLAFSAGTLLLAAAAALLQM